MAETNSDSDSANKRERELARSGAEALARWIDAHQEQIAERVDDLLPLPFWLEPFDGRLVEAAIDGLEQALIDLASEDD